MLVNKKNIYYWNEKLLGVSPNIRSLYNLIPETLRLVLYVLVLFALGYGIFFIIAKNPNFIEILKYDLEESSRSNSWIAGSFLSMILTLAFDFLKALAVLIKERGVGPLMFWTAVSGIAYTYYYQKTKNTSKKLISPASSDFEVFYNEKYEGEKVAVNIADYTSSSAKELLNLALDLAHRFKQVPDANHLALALANNSRTGVLLKRLEIDLKEFAYNIEAIIKELPENDYYSKEGILKGTIMSPKLEEMILFAFEETLAVGMDEIEAENLLLSLFHDELLKKYFKDRKVEIEDARNVVLWLKSWSQRKIRLNRPRKIRHTIMNRAWTARVTPELDRFSYDLTDQARAGLTGCIVNRKRELDNIMRILERTSKNNALLIGEEGSGRTSIVKELANRMTKDQVLPTLRDKRLVVLDIGSLVAGARAGGNLELRIRRLLEDMAKSGNIILFIPDIHNIAAAGSGEGFDASKVFSPILSEGIFQIIGSTDYRNYHRYIEPRADFANSFDLIKIEELDEKTTIEVLALQARIIEAREGVVMAYSAIKKAVELSRRYITDRLLPGKAIDLLSETAVEVRRKGAGAILRGEDIMEIITEKTGIPLTDISASEAEKLLTLEEELHKRVIGQYEAVKAIASSIRRVRVGMKHESRPIGTFLFLGPTGVGKTELAKALAEVYYGDERAMIRLDMSEYQTVGSVEKLIGSSSDLSESSIGGALTEAVKRKPFSLILLDELEKADKNVLNLFLQVFDDGRLTDSLGRTVDFTNTIIIATSNAGSRIVRKMVMDKESNNERMFQILEPYLLQSFAPEFLNRFTAKIVFKSLSEDEVTAIAKLQIKKLAERFDKAQGIKITISDEALKTLASIGYSAEYGARFLQRTIQERVENLVATKFLKGEIKRGDEFGIEDKDI